MKPCRPYRRVRWAIAGPLTLLCACATVPRSEPAPVPLAGTAVGLQGVAVAPARDGWWQSLQDPQLNTLIARALSDNPGLAQAEARLRLAQAQAQAAHADQLPGAKIAGGENRLKVPEGFGPYLLGGHDIWFGNLHAQLAWDLDLWGQHAAAAAAARGMVVAADLDADNARLLLAGAITQAYVDLYRSYALADIAASAEAQRVHISEITRKRVGAGLDTRAELREAEGAVPQAHLALLQAQSAQELTKHQLAALIGQGAGAYAGIQRPRLNLAAVLPLPTALPMNLLARRPDVIAARARIAAADANKRAARAAFYPSISLSALAGYASVSLPQLVSAQSLGYGAGAALSLPLFDGGRLRAGYRGAEAGLDQAVASYDDTVLQAVRQAADQLSLISSLGGELQQQRRWQDATEDAYRLDEERYRAGLASYLSVLNAETEVLSARRQSVDLAAAQAMARVTLLVAVGGSFH